MLDVIRRRAKVEIDGHLFEKIQKQLGEKNDDGHQCRGKKASHEGV